MSFKLTSFSLRSLYLRTPETAVRGCWMSFNYQVRTLSWCTPCYVLSTTLRFERTESLSPSSRKYARYVSSRDLAQVAHFTGGYNLCMQITSLIGILTILFSRLFFLMGSW